MGGGGTEADGDGAFLVLLAFVDRVVRAEPLSPEEARRHPDVADLVLRCQMHKCTPGCRPPATSSAAKAARQRAVEQRPQRNASLRQIHVESRGGGASAADRLRVEPILDPDGVTYTPMSRQEINELTRKRIMCRHRALGPAATRRISGRRTSRT